MSWCKCIHPVVRADTAHYETSNNPHSDLRVTASWPLFCAFRGVQFLDFANCDFADELLQLCWSVTCCVPVKTWSRQSPLLTAASLALLARKWVVRLTRRPELLLSQSAKPRRLAWHDSSTMELYQIIPQSRRGLLSCRSEVHVASVRAERALGSCEPSQNQV